MTDEAALLRAILDHPDDDTARLVYADWLYENDRPERAVLIWSQCEDGQQWIVRPNGTVGYRNPDGSHSSVFITPVGRLSYTMRRGFIEGVRGPLAALRTHLPALVAREPVARVEVTDQSPNMVYIHGRNEWRFVWYRWPEADEAAGRPIPPGYIPAALWETPYIAAEPVWDGRGVYGRDPEGRVPHRSARAFLSSENAMAELGAALLAEARQIAAR